MVIMRYGIYNQTSVLFLLQKCFHVGVSSPPGRPTIELSTRRAENSTDDTGVTDEINIIWSVPDDDGGYPITGIVSFL